MVVIEKKLVIVTINKIYVTVLLTETSVLQFL